MTARPVSWDVEGTSLGHCPPPPSPWPLLMCTSGLICPVEDLLVGEEWGACSQVVLAVGQLEAL